MELATVFWKKKMVCDACKKHEEKRNAFTEAFKQGSDNFEISSLPDHVNKGKHIYIKIKKH